MNHIKQKIAALLLTMTLTAQGALTNEQLQRAGGLVLCAGAVTPYVVRESKQNSKLMSLVFLVPGVILLTNNGSRTMALLKNGLNELEKLTEQIFKK